MSVLLDLIRGESRASAENPSVSPTWDNVIGGSQTGTINLDAALTVSGFFRGVNLISRALGKVPVLTYERTKSGKERAITHPAYWLLKTQPNERQTPMVFKQTIIAHALVKGGGYAWIERDGAAKPLSLNILDPDRTMPVLVTKNKKSKLWFVTEVTTAQGETKTVKLRSSDVFHVPGLGWDGLNGWSLLQYGATSIGDAKNTMDFTKRFFENNTHMGVVLTIPDTTDLSVEARKELREGWNRMQQGIDSVAKTAVLHQGITATQMQLNAKDAQLLESKQFSLRDLANWFSLPSHKLGGNTTTSYNSLEQENQAMLDEAYDPWMVTFEQECNKKLLTEAERATDSHFCEFLRIALVRLDAKTRAEVYAKGLAGAPWLTIDGVRSAENLNETGQEWTKQIVLPTNNFGTDPDAEPPTEPPPNNIQAAADSAYDDAAERVKKRLALQFSRQGADFWAGDYKTKHDTVCRDMLQPSIDMQRALGCSENLMQQTIDEIIQTITNEA